MMPPVSSRVARGGPSPACPPGAPRFAARGLATLSLAACLVLSPHARAADCPSAFDITAHVTGVDLSGDLILSDAGRVRLAGLAFGEDRTALRAALERLVVGRDVAIAASAAQADRYGRRGGLVRVGADGPSVQHALLSRGLALAQPEEGMLGCMAELVKAEAPARKNKLGLWAGMPLDARDIDGLSARQGRFTILTGRVRSVGKGRGVDYLNFGPIWRQDMTVRLDSRARAAFEQAGTPLQAFAGRQIEARGVVFEAGGPAIDVRWVEQVEMAKSESGAGD